MRRKQRIIRSAYRKTHTHKTTYEQKLHKTLNLLLHNYATQKGRKGEREKAKDKIKENVYFLHSPLSIRYRRWIPLRVRLPL